MQSQIQDRLIGALVVFIIAAIFLTVLFHHPLPGLESKTLKNSVPEAPSAKVVFNLPSKARTLNPLAQTLNSSASSNAHRVLDLDATEARSTNAAETALSPQAVKPYHPKKIQLALPEAWVVQLATFRDSAHANQLIKKLRQQNIESYLGRVKFGSGHLFRVYVGPYIQYDKAISSQKSLKHTYAMNGIVKKYVSLQSRYLM